MWPTSKQELRKSQILKVATSLRDSYLLLQKCEYHPAVKRLMQVIKCEYQLLTIQIRMGYNVEIEPID